MRAVLTLLHPYHVLQELPRVEKELEDLVLAWEVQNGRPFLIGGKTVSDFLLDTWHQYHERKELEKKERVSLIVIQYKAM